MLSRTKKILFKSPMRTIFITYAAVIFTGASILFLPISQNSGVELLSFLDCLFTATSAACVTGLVVVQTITQWSLFGQIIILILIQIGGLSIITITGFLAIIMGKKIGFRDRVLLQNMSNHSHTGGVVKMTKSIIKFTFVFEGVGFILLAAYFFFFKNTPLLQSLYYGLFHSVSAFCNAGFDILGTTSLLPYSNDFFINAVLMVLIVSGGIGFIVWKDVIAKLKYKKHRFSITSKLAIISTLLLIFFGALIFFFLEHDNQETIGGYSLGHQILASFFQSVTLRTAGFSSLNQNGLNESSKFIASMLMLVGGSPGGMAGGIKTVTLAVIISSIWSIVRGREGIQIMKRSVSLKVLQRALAVTGIMIGLFFASTFVLCISEDKSIFAHTFLDIMFEASSALATVGLTTGITPYLSVIGKMVIISSMFIGRVGPITVIYALTHPKQNDCMILPKTEILIG